MFYATTDFPFTRMLEANVDRICAEAESIRNLMVDWVERELHDHGWQIYGLYNFPGGELLPENAARCPFTTRIIAETIPTHGAAGFSLLKPQSRIRPHRGYAGRFLRCHLPLATPKGDCALRVESEIRGWQRGECIIFDDRLEHEAWNLTDEPRMILLIDFVPPNAH